MKLYRKILAAAALISATAAFGQGTPFGYGGSVVAYNFNYGGNAYKGGSPPAPLIVGIGNTATGTGSITLQYGNIHTSDGITFMPLSTHAPILIGSGTNAETVTPTAVSCGTPTAYNTCTITASFANIHGVGDLVSSGSLGIEEAAVYQVAQGGGPIWITQAIAQAKGGVAATRTYLHTLNGCTTVPLVTAMGDASAAAFSLASTGTCSGSWSVWTATTVSWY